jgi:hypothetical protein
MKGLGIGCCKNTAVKHFSRMGGIHQNLYETSSTVIIKHQLLRKNKQQL